VWLLSLGVKFVIISGAGALGNDCQRVLVAVGHILLAVFFFTCLESQCTRGIQLVKAAVMKSHLENGFQYLVTPGTQFCRGDHAVAHACAVSEPAGGDRCPGDIRPVVAGKQPLVLDQVVEPFGGME